MAHEPSSFDVILNHVSAFRLLTVACASLGLVLPATLKETVPVRMNGESTPVVAKMINGSAYVSLKDVSTLFGGKAVYQDGAVEITQLQPPPMAGLVPLRTSTDQWILVSGSRGAMFVRSPIVDDSNLSFELGIKHGFFEPHDGPITASFVLTLYDRGKSPIDRQTASVDSIADVGGTYKLEFSSSDLDTAKFLSVSFASSWFPEG